MTIEILVADADPTVRSHYQWLGLKRGFKVYTTETGLECWTLLKSYVPDVLVIDSEILWGGSDGVLERLRKCASSADLPEVIVTGNQTADALHKRFAVDSDRCYQKPVELSTLFDLIESFAAWDRNGELSKRSEAS